MVLNIIWPGATLAALAVFRGRFELSRRSTRTYAALHVALFALLLLGYVLQTM